MAFVPVSWRVRPPLLPGRAPPPTFPSFAPCFVDGATTGWRHHWPRPVADIFFSLPSQDVGKSSSDLLSKDFPLGATSLEVKTKAPSGVAFTVRGSKDAASNAINGDLEAKYNGWKNGYAVTQVRPPPLAARHRSRG